MHLVRRFAPSLVGGVAGFVIMWSAWHLYIDHVTFHNLINAIQQQQAQTAAAAPHK